VEKEQEYEENELDTSGIVIICPESNPGKETKKVVTNTVKMNKNWEVTIDEVENNVFKDAKAIDIGSAGPICYSSTGCPPEHVSYRTHRTAQYLHSG
jgi:hypothetical protein